ncbi:glycosyltransferase family 39 protein [Paludisphaera sp.]|uniref:glycosyltransferase family 39 protein n=1 Tax=Paludisphaera sp. TaxID=2017432 RepID=UPI00301DA417
MPISDALTRQVDLVPFSRRLAAFVLRRPLWTCVWLGVALRVWVYLHARSYWMDEASLLGNLKGKAPFDFTGHLASDQLAPPGFLAAERALIGLLGESPYVARLIPMICGVAALFLFRRFAGRLLEPTAAVVAMVLFAFSDDLVYYSNELKPYSTDLALGLAVTLLSLSELRDPPDRRRLWAIAALAVASPWLSFPSAFVVAGCGLTLLIDRLRDGRKADAARLAAIALAWGFSLMLAYRTSSRMLAPATSMYVFWNFAFPPFPPTSPADLAKTMGILLETFVTPLNLVPRVLPYAFALFAATLGVSGALWLARKDPAALAILLVPAALALVAATTRRYPFHGRLILWLAPAFLALIAQGAARVRWSRGAAWLALVLVLLMAYPVVDALYQAAPPHVREFNPHGDLRRNRFMD